MKKNMLSCALAVLLTLALLPVSVWAEPAEQGLEMATREYAINAFAYTLGRNSLRNSEPAVLTVYTDESEISGAYRYNIALAIAGGLTRDMDASDAQISAPQKLRPQEEVTRLSALMLLANSLSNLPETTSDSGFTDVPDFARARVNSLVKAGYLPLTEDRLLRPDEALTRSEVDALTDILDGAHHHRAAGGRFLYLHQPLRLPQRIQQFRSGNRGGRAEDHLVVLF